MAVPIKLFLVEDEIISALSLTAQLRNMGYVLQKPASTGEEAVKGAREEQPDLILMDINLLDEMDGITAAKKIKADRDVPIIFITGYSDKEILDRASETRPAAIFTKPLDVEKLNIEILKALWKNSDDISEKGI